MVLTDENKKCGRVYPASYKMVLLGVNGVCFGACLVLLALTSVSGPLILLLIGTGLSLSAGLMGAIIAARCIDKEVTQ